MKLTESERKYWRMRLNHLRSETEAVLRILAEDATQETPDKPLHDTVNTTRVWVSTINTQ